MFFDAQGRPTDEKGRPIAMVSRETVSILKVGGAARQEAGGAAEALSQINQRKAAEKEKKQKQKEEAVKQAEPAAADKSILETDPSKNPCALSQPPLLRVRARSCPW